jgi:hypothetical protein
VDVPFELGHTEPKAKVPVLVDVFCGALTVAVGVAVAFAFDVPLVTVQAVEVLVTSVLAYCA